MVFAPSPVTLPWSSFKNLLTFLSSLRNDLRFLELHPLPPMTIPWSFWNLLTPLPTTTPWDSLWKHLADTVKPKNIQVGRVHGSGRVNWRKMWFKFIWRGKCYRYFFELFIELKVKFTEFSWGKAKPMCFRVTAFTPQGVLKLVHNFAACTHEYGSSL